MFVDIDLWLYFFYIWLYLQKISVDKDDQVNETNDKLCGATDPHFFLEPLVTT